MSIRQRRQIDVYLAVAVAVAYMAAAGGCLYDAGDRCSAGQELDASDICVCQANYAPVHRDITVITPASPTEYVPVAYCAPCGENQVVANGACACRPEYVQGPAGCVPSNLGAACTGDTDCAAGDKKFCRLPEGYCTSQGCASNADCSSDADYACAADPAGAYCKRPPLNQGAPCATQGVDPLCGPEAPVCALGSCAVFGCAVDADCSPSRKCCDLSRFSPGMTVTLCLGTCP